MKERTLTEITFEWMDGIASNYEVFWDESNKQFERLAVTSNTEYSMPIEDDFNALIRIKVRAVNECFVGEFSPPLVLDFSG